jgi:hypothetical protein
MPRSLALLTACAMLATACAGEDATGSPPTSVRSPSGTEVPSSPSASPTPPDEPSVSPTPDGAVLIETDASVRELDPADLAPPGTDVTGRWIGSVDGTNVLVLAVAGEGDAFARDRALWRWAPAPDPGGWLGVELVAHPMQRGVLGLDAVVADVTDDGNDDALVFALTGGSGACGTWSVYDLVTADRVFARALCDATVDPAFDPVGLLITGSVYRAGDPHCCPSARRETILTYDGDARWTAASRATTPL